MREGVLVWLRERLPWLLLPVVVVGAFAVGTYATGAAAPEPDSHEDGQGEPEEVWTCAMHPQIRQPEPGQCPICGMDLIPVGAGGDSESAPGRVTLSEHGLKMARIRTVPVGRLGGGGLERRLLGRLNYDETTLRSVTAWTGGRIDRLHVQTTGEQVRRGQTIASLYSPEIHSAQQDVIEARRQLEAIGSGTATARRAAQAALDSSVQRLRLLGVPAETVARMQEADSPSRNVPIRSPFAGTVIERIATEGQYVTTGSPLYRIADLSRLWVQLDAYESDLPYLSIDQPVSLEVSAFAGEPFDGRVAFIDPVVDHPTRTAHVRVEIDNPDGRLLPGMFAEAVVEGSLPGVEESAVVVPATATMWTGRRSMVYVEVPGAAQPTYDLRVVRLGARMGDVYPVVAGIEEGERIVVHGAFALDAQLQIRGGASMMMHPDDLTSGQFDDAVVVDAAFREGLRPVVEGYLELQERLAADDLEGATGAAEATVAAIDAFQPAQPAEARAAWEHIGGQLSEPAARVAAATSIDVARSGFQPLGRHVIHALRVFGNPLDAMVHVAFCPMAFDDQGAHWVQRGDEIRNPYFGDSMLTCGVIQEMAGAGEYLPPPHPEAAGAGAGAGGHQH